MRGDRVRHTLMIAATHAAVRGGLMKGIDANATVIADRVIEADGLAIFAKREERQARDRIAALGWDDERSVSEQALESPWWLAIPSRTESVRVPDLVAIQPDGTCHALEIELSPKSIDRYKSLLADYYGSYLTSLTYLVASKAIEKRIITAAESLGIERDFLRIIGAPLNFIEPTNNRKVSK